MASSTMESLFDSDRFATGNIPCIPMLFYIPIGVVLFTVRLFIFLHALLIHCILPQTASLRSWVLRVMLAVTGIIITTDGEDGHDSRVRVLVANHVSNLDHFVTSVAVPHALYTECSGEGTTWFPWVLGLKMFAPELGKEELVRSIKKYCQGSYLPLLFFPEKIPTNGRQGLLKFSTLPFKLNCAIQPIGIQTKRITVFPVNVSTLGSSWWSDIFWCLFVPCTIFKIKYLPVTQKKDTESEEEFCERVRGNMGRNLDLQVTEFSAADVSERTKRDIAAVSTKSSANSRPAETPASSDLDPCLVGRDPEVVHMVKQIQEVLSHAPTAAILKDILVTRDVDLTISNILEGRVPLESPRPTDQAPSSAGTAASGSQGQVTLDASSVQYKASTFGKSTRERTMSFQERKQAMMEAARKKYMVKHGMI